MLVVWIGDFEGQGNPAFVGVDAAAPLFFRIADALNPARGRRKPVPPLAPPPGVSRSRSASSSGDLPNADCPHTVDTVVHPGQVADPRQPAASRRRDRSADRAPGCPPYAAGTRFEVFEFWPSDMLKLFRQAGMPRRTPPLMPGCARRRPGMDAPRIASPVRSRQLRAEAIVTDRNDRARCARRRGDRPRNVLVSRCWKVVDLRRGVGRRTGPRRAPATAGVHLIWRSLTTMAARPSVDVEVQISQ